MAALISWLKAKPIAPERVSTDKVVPLYALDDTGTNRSVSLNVSMRFDDALDVDKLVGALEKLLARPGWRKLGARVRLNTDGKLEYHIPAEYTRARPAANISHVKHDMDISQHPLGSQLLRPNGSIQVSPDVRTFRPLLVAENSPTVLAHWTYTDRAQLSVHIVSFNDATLITLTWMHTLFDAMGRQALLKAWIAQLEGREQDIPDYFSPDIDPLGILGAPINDKLQSDEGVKEESYVLKDKVLSGWKFVRFVLGMMWELILHRKEEMRTMIIPQSFYTRLRAEALADLSTLLASHNSSASLHNIPMDTNDPLHPKPFLSDGDILTAWSMRLRFQAQPWITSASPRKTIQVMNVFGMRELLTTTEPKLLPKGVAYISNCVTAVSSFFSLKELLSLPLGLLAARLRTDLVTQTTRSQINARIRLEHECIAATGRPLLFGDANMALAACSNWTKARHFETDFSAAVLRRGQIEHVVGRPTYLQADGTTNGFSLRNSGPCMGRDEKGNWWIEFMLRPEAWTNVQRAIQGLS